MSLNSHIEWTDATWNPVRGCTKISPGCKHCYAETFAERFRGVKGHPYEQGFDLRLVPEKLTEPLTWRSPKLVFVNSMSDLFQDGVPDEYIEAVCRVMTMARWHTFQVLTKRSKRMREMLKGKLRFAAKQEHIWWGVSVEDKKYGRPRINDLRRASARMNFLSIEPLLEDLGEINLKGIDWAIVGGESGPGARPLHREWVFLCGISAGESGSRSSSSSGAESEKFATAESWMVRLMTNIPSGPLLRFRIEASALNSRIGPDLIWTSSACTAGWYRFGLKRRVRTSAVPAGLARFPHFTPALACRAIWYRRFAAGVSAMRSIVLPGIQFSRTRFSP